MKGIIQKTSSSVILRVSPSWCEGDHSEEVRAAVAHAEDLFDRRCLNDLADPDDDALKDWEIKRRLEEPTFVRPVIKRNKDGHDRCLNDSSSMIASRSFHPRRQIGCFILNEEKVSADRLKLIEFRFRELDGALLPHGHKERKYRADRLIRRLTDDIELCRLIELLWLGREPVGLSAAEKSGLTNGHISKSKFNPSFQQSRAVSPRSDPGADEVQDNSREAG
ncbi:hypothetical protein [Spiribacter sp. SSL99]|uniref:hypothetical protein n=1 Tax=Spiribacter sp. SSL99 TaxID=1866884 RepID=UPI001330CC47|nr:hypothetical protein [Spiribacter sp. SSL99]